jgi:hypothetical protein
VPRDVGAVAGQFPASAVPACTARRINKTNDDLFMMITCFICVVLQSIDCVGPTQNILRGHRAAGAGGEADKGGVGTDGGRDIDGPSLLPLRSGALVNSLHRNLHAQTRERQGCCLAFDDLTTPIVGGTM